MWCGVLQALEFQAGFTDSNNGQEFAVSQQQWDEFLTAFMERLKLLRLIANVSLALSWGGAWVFAQLPVWLGACSALLVAPAPSCPLCGC